MRVRGFTLLINESFAKALKAGNVRGLNIFEEIRTFYIDDGRDADAFQAAIQLATELSQ